MRMRNAATLLLTMASVLATVGAARASHCGAASYSSCCQPASDAQCCYPSAAQQMKVCYKLVHDTVIEKRWVTCYQTVNETVMKQVSRTCYRDETKTCSRRRLSRRSRTSMCKSFAAPAIIC